MRLAVQKARRKYDPRKVNSTRSRQSDPGPVATIHRIPIDSCLELISLD